MNIFVNGSPVEVSNELSAAELIERLGLSGKRLALEINREIVPRSTFIAHRLKADDRIEIIHAIGGG